MSLTLVRKAEEPGSAVIAAGKLHASAHVHAVRYGHVGSAPYRKAYSQHVGRFLSAVRSFSTKRPVEKSVDEPRDAIGRWMAAMESAGHRLYGTTGLTGLNRSQVVGKVRDVLDRASGHQAGSRAASYLAAATGKAAAVASGTVGAPSDVAGLLEHHVATATGHVIGKAMSSPVWRRLATATVLGIRKSEELKDLVAETVADTPLHPRVANDDAALASVAHGAHRHLTDRLQALRMAAVN